MKKYKKNLGIILRRIENRFYILKNNQLFEINEIGARIVDMCDGTNTSVMMCNKLIHIYQVSDDEVIKDITAYLEILENMGVIYSIPMNQ